MVRYMITAFVTAAALAALILNPVTKAYGMDTEQATFGAGCFWGVESAFMKVPGVLKTEVGYAGGTVKNPTYRQVCNGNTGHAEVVHLTFDPARVTYEELLRIFWSIHNPTTMNRQGPDVGYQYRSVVFYYGPEQKAAAEKVKAEINASGPFKGRVVTAIEEAHSYYPAEEYHQQYFKKQGKDPACHVTF